MQEPNISAEVLLSDVNANEDLSRTPGSCLGLRLGMEIKTSFSNDFEGPLNALGGGPNVAKASPMAPQSSA